LRAVGLSSGLQKSLVGGPNTLPIADPANYTIGGNSTTSDARLNVLRGDYTAESPEPAQSAALDAANTMTLLRNVNINGYVTANSAVYPTSSFGRALRSVAALIKADIGIEAAQVDIGGWDTHSAQNPISGSMFNTMRDFSNSLAAFYTDVMSIGTYPVTLVSVSEFGRNVKENGSNGTDHGRGTVMFAMGKGIAGGRVLVNQWPGLAQANLESGQDLKVTIDYRDVLAEIVTKRLGNTNTGFVFPGWSVTTRGVTR